MSKGKKSKKSQKNKKKESGSSSIQNWLKRQQDRKPILKFGLGLAFIMFLYYSINYTAFFEDNINLPIVKGYANIGSFLLNLFGFETVVDSAHIRGALFDMNIGKGCDAVSPTVLFLAAISVYPTSFSNKWKWLLGAPFAFAALNLVRIISLYLIGAYMPSFFDFAHIEFWQGVFIFITIIAWFYWLFLILSKKQTHAST